jgi:integrase
MAKRENGSGTIIRRKFVNSTKYVAWTPARYENIDGKIVTKRDKIGAFATRKEAREALELYNKHPTLKYNFTLTDVYEDWKRSAFADIGAQTQTSWTTSWAKIKDCPEPDLSGKLMREITTGEIRQLLDYYANERMGSDKEGKPITIPPLSKSYITKIKALMTQLCDHAVENNIVDRNYAALVKLPKMEAGTRRAFTDLEFAKLEKGWETATGGDAVLVLCYTGFRVTEFCQLTRFAYDPNAKTLTGGIKTDAGRDRIVPVHPKIQPIIESWYKASKGPLYPRPDGKAYTKDSFAKGVWQPCMRSLGLPDDLTPHSARHTFGTRMAAAGARPEDIQKILGHTDYSMTANTYINQDVSALQSAVRLLG